MSLEGRKFVKNIIKDFKFFLGTFIILFSYNIF